MRRLCLSLVLLAAGAGLLVAAALAAGSAETARKGGTLRVGSAVEPDSLDPALAGTARAFTLEFATCAKLFNLPDAAGEEGARVIPEVVDSSPVSPDGKTYTFDLKRTFRFDTGARVTAQSFAEAFNRDANPKLRSPATAYMHEIVGADAVLAGKATTISGVRVLAPYRLQIKLTKPVPDFIARLTTPYFCPLLPNTPVDSAGIDHAPGSGPYYIAERVVNRQTVFKRNPYYRGDRPANVDRIVFTPGEKADDCALAIEQDRLDICINTPLSDATYRRLYQQYGINQSGGQFFVTPSLATWYFAFNHERAAFKGPGQIPLKKAINYAIDRPALVRAFGYVAGRRDDQMLPPTLGRDESFYPVRGADPATARKWLERAKFKPSKLVLYADTTPGGVTAAQVFAFDLKQIGIDVEVKYFDQVAHSELAGTRGEPFDVAFSAWSVDYADPAAYFEPLLDGENISASGNYNYSYLDDPKVNAKIAAANRLGGAARRKAWSRLDAGLMRDNPPWAPFIHTTRVYFVSRSFGCFLYHSVYSVDIAAACKK